MRAALLSAMLFVGPATAGETSTVDSGAPEAAAPAAAPRAAAREAVALSPFEWEGVARVVAVGDIHGGIDKLTRVLHAARLIDAAGNWSGGRDHLVLIGDLIDRGPADREVLDLARRLQGEAAAAGGRVHVLLGNHEVMNLVRDLRYVNPQSYAEFAEYEKPAEREKAEKKFLLERRINGETVKSIQAAFDAEHPFGYFGRLKAFGPGGSYAEWLLRQSVAVKINGVVYVHGGLTEEFARRGLEALTREVRENVRSFWKLRDEMGAGPFARYEDVQRAALEAVRLGADDARLATARQLVELQSGAAFSPAGPLWYRGLSLENERAEAFSLDAVLDALGARTIVVGHTPTKTGKVQSRFEGRVLRIDASLLGTQRPAALVDEQGVLSVLEFPADASPPAAGAVRHAPRAEAPWGEKWTAGLADLPHDQLEKFLAAAEVTDIRPLGKGSTRPRLLEMQREGLRLRGLFKDVSTPAQGNRPANRYEHEVAAYRLDRLLGFDLVPVTVTRRIDATTGSLQAWVEAAVTPSTAESYALQPRDPQAVRAQMERGRIFDALIGNARRGRGDLLLIPGESRLMLVDHGEAFTLERDPAAILGDEPCRLDPALRDRLAHLGAQDLEGVLGGFIDRQPVAALLARRDRLLEICN